SIKCSSINSLLFSLTIFSTYNGSRSLITSQSIFIPFPPFLFAVFVWLGDRSHMPNALTFQPADQFVETIILQILLKKILPYKALTIHVTFDEFEMLTLYPQAYVRYHFLPA